jgi:PAS domain S-box-containing protein
MKADTDIHPDHDLLTGSDIDAIIGIDTDNIITSWNAAATKLFNLHRDETIGKPLFNILPSIKDDADLQAAIRLAKGGNKSFLGASENFNYRKHAEAHLVPLRTNENVVGVMILIHDISHRVAEEAALRRLNEELQTPIRQLRLTRSELALLTHIASHHIRHPIREIYTTVEGLLRTEAGAISNHGRASFRRIQSSLNRMNLLLDDITTLTQIDITARPLSQVDLSEVINELKEQFAKRFQETRTTLTVGDLCDIYAHSSQVRLMLQHFFSSIIKSAAFGAPLIHLNCIKTRLTAKKGDHGITGEYFLLSIKHNGTAFDNVDINNTFHISENTDVHNYTGSAITMLIASKIMEVHSGFLMIEKMDNDDTRINCYFPVL